MKTRTRKACVAAAVAALMVSGQFVSARDLTWDANGTDDLLIQDGDGVWDTSSPNWFDTTTTSNVTWSNAPADSAIFGTTTVGTITAGAVTRNVDLGGAITVQDITFKQAADGAAYSVTDFGGGPLTLLGNVYKPALNGSFQFFLQTSGGLVLGDGQHTFTLHDSSGDTPFEVRIDGDVHGTGGITLDNAAYESWGTLALTGNNDYAGPNVITRGRLISSNGTGFVGRTATTTITGAGSLFLGGSGVNYTGSTDFNAPIVIQRNTYTGGDANDGGAFAHYPAALAFGNAGGAKSFTLTGQVTIDSTDGRIGVYTNTLTVPAGSIVYTPAAIAANGVVSFTGDTAGFVKLVGSNPQFATTGVKFADGVEVSFDSDDSFGGATAPLNFAGSATLDLTGHPTMTTFGAHPINTTNFGGGVDVPAGQSFTMDRTITSGQGLGKRGVGSLTFNAPITGTGNIFWDGGQIDVNSAVALGTIHTRSPIININNGGSLTLSGGNFNSFGSDSTGTAGGPDITTINITGNGQLIQNNGNDFNLSDNNNTKGTINLGGTGTLTSGGIMFIGKSNGATGTINMTGGTLNSTRTGNFGFVLADGRGPDSPVGIFTMSGGTFTANGEVYVGEGGSNAVGGARGHGFWTQTAGNVTFKNWFVVGRESAVGNFDISGGTINQTGGNFDLGDSNAGGEANTINIHGNASITTTGEFWIGNNGGVVANATLADTASVSVSNWLAIGRGGNATGTLNMTGGTINQTGVNWLTIGSGGTGTLTITGGTINAARMYVGQNGGATSTFNINGGAVNLANNLIFANQDSATGNLNLNGGTLTAPGFTAQNGGGTGKGNFTFNGGTLRANADNTNFVGAKVTSIVSTGGAKIDSNGKSITYNSALTHDVTLAGTDGGLTKSGAGTLALTGANTYTGLTTVQAGTLQAKTTGSLPGYSTAGQVTIAASTTLAVNAGGTGEWTEANIATLRSTVPFPAGSALGIDTTNATAPFTYSQVLSGSSIGLTKLGSGTLTLTGANAYTGPTLLTGTGTLVLAPAASSPVLTGPGGAILNGGKLVFDYTGTPSTPATVTALLQSSYGHSNFHDSSQLIYTTLPADPTRGLGSIDNPAAQTFTVTYALYGDTNFDGKVNRDDYAAMDRGAAKHLLGWQNGDYDYSGVIDSADYLLIDKNFAAANGLSPDLLASREAQFGSEYVSQLIAAVPEPTSLGLAGIAAFGLIARRRRSRVA